MGDGTLVKTTFPVSSRLHIVYTLCKTNLNTPQYIKHFNKNKYTVHFKLYKAHVQMWGVSLTRTWVKHV